LKRFRETSVNGPVFTATRGVSTIWRLPVSAGACGRLRLFADFSIAMSLEMTLDTSVTVLARDGDDTFEADSETERMLLDAIAQCERGDTIPLPQLLGQLRNRE
jgi:hypothetical protein